MLTEFDRRFAPRLAVRAATFRRVFESMLAQGKSDYLIVETGTCHLPDAWESHGQSTRLFDWFVGCAGGRVFSVDHEPLHVEVARALVSENTEITCRDSVKYLWQARFDRPIDLLYLDSFDVERANPHPSSLHHIKELAAAMDKLQTGSIVMVDDWISDDVAKGRYVADFMRDIDAILLFQSYQVAWVLP